MKKYSIVLGIILILFNICFADKWWGAFYMDNNTGIAGGSFNYGTEKQAFNEAKQSCIDKHDKKKIASNCKSVISFYNTCAAIYWSPENKKMGWGYAFVPVDAKINARIGCANNGGKNCQLTLSVCTTRFM